MGEELQVTHKSIFFPSSPMKDALNWFEINVADFARAQSFYETLLDVPLRVQEVHGVAMGIFPYDSNLGVGGAIIHRKGAAVGAGGPVVFLIVTGRLEAVLERVDPAGGAILLPRAPIPPYGFMSIIQDSEGNSIGLHSP